MSDGAPSAQELERLVRERDELNDQIKLLVQTEQRLYRSQNALDEQLTRIRALSSFTLSCSAAERPDEIIARAVDLLQESFGIDCAAAVSLDPDEPTLWIFRSSDPGASGPRPIEVAADTLEWARSLPRSSVLSPEDEACLGALRAPLGAAEACALGQCSPDDEPRTLTCLTLRRESRDLFGLILICSRPTRRPSYFRQPLDSAQVPFLELVSLHVEHAVENAALAADVRQRTRALEETNQQLKQSLDTLENAQRQLLQAQKMEAIGRLAGGVAHDFNNLLTIVLSRADMLRELVPPSSATREHVDSITEAGARAAKITGQLLAFGRKQPYTPEPFDINKQTMEMCQVLGPLIGGQIALDLRLDPNIGCIRGDRAQFEQILLNLVLNARDAMPDGGVLTVRTRHARADDCADLHPHPDPTHFVAMVVEDTGDGMDEETRRQVFEPFFSTKEFGRGTGMGLASVYGLVKQHSGHVVVTSEVGRGSSFMVLFRSTTSGEDEERTVEAAPDPARLSVLLAEDEDGIRGFAARALRDHGYEVLEARDGVEALELVEGRETPLDLLITDVVMPRLGGFELARELQAAHPLLRVLFMSGYSLTSMEEAAEFEAASVLAKPFTVSMFLEHVRRLLEGRVLVPRAPATGELRELAREDATLPG